MTAPGATPGTVKVSPDAARPVLQVFAYGPDQLVETEIGNLDDLKEILDKHPVTWINVDGLGDAATIEKLGEIFGLHSLALEDVVNVHQRPKVEEYGEHLFIVARMVSLADVLDIEQLSIFLGKNFVLTLQDRPGDCLDPVREHLRKGHGRIRTTGPDYLAYALLDAVVDNYFPIVDQYGERIEALDEDVTTNHSPRVLDNLHDLRGDLMLIRRAIRPLRDALIRLMPDPNRLITEETQFYLRDCYDHTVQLIDLLDNYRELCADLRDFYLSSVSNRLNEIMKVLTIIATIFIPLSFVAGLYGMNFDTRVSRWNMPELHWTFGYPFALTIMLAMAGGMLYFFWRKGWIGPQSAPPGGTRGRGGKPGESKAKELMVEE